MEALLHRKESIILTAVEIIHELGIQGLSTREIARRQEISEGAIFKHFKNKNEILLGVLEHYSQYDTDIIESIAMKSLKPIEAIKYFVRAYAEYYENYPAITAIAQAYDVFSCDPKLAWKIKDIFDIRNQFIVKMVGEAQAAGEILPHVNIENLSDVIVGLCNSICLKWRLNHFNFSLKERTLSTLEMILSAFFPVHE
ncbi:AcrR family transcriptional regulator [Anaerosolibacter carboniphilus]|uniref:AcrR family transcriptional regulator n=1 Tax=Anaerosolibacter carboniphilus TaxID=1417629 RepID=A0A841L1I2_9FIRM|nr:TetR/AcrR family transcriptional regulator [Anaerosolibacter carboniphilus]MBB6216225.1 AcrR family transcriptional regulator [Anaerosolibacter carboniphilus]